MLRRLLELSGAKDPKALETLVKSLNVRLAAVNRDLLTYKVGCPTNFASRKHASRLCNDCANFHILRAVPRVHPVAERLHLVHIAACSSSNEHRTRMLHAFGCIWTACTCQLSLDCCITASVNCARTEHHWAQCSPEPL